MNRNFFTMIVMAGALIMGTTACSGKKGGEATDNAADSTAQETTEVTQETPKAFPWDFPEGIALENPDMGQYILSIHTFYPKNIATEEHPEDKVYIFYSATLSEYGDTHSKVNSHGKEIEMPNSLIILLPKGEKVKVGDILLTWWQSGSGLQRAIVTDASDPEAPKVDYLDLDYDDDPAKKSLAMKFADEQIKPSTFAILKDGEWQPGATIAINEKGSWKEGILIHATDDKVLALCFAGKIRAYKRANCRLIPIKQDLKVGDNVRAVYVDSFSDGYKITKIDRKIGRVWVEKDGKTEIVSILEVVKSL